MTEENLLKREELSQRTLGTMGKFMFSAEWEIYSFKLFFKQIIDFYR